ncbi:MAG: YqiA/YcfP family alpha/beta fold hydrolase [Pseudomonadota bacterium]|nr:YqiA/YcfP family alpha/beta fold hydrolase [Pseudomonadota bacterium]
MQLIYIHGFNSDSQSAKGRMLREWAAQHRPELRVQCPDLNQPPEQVMALLDQLIQQDPQTALVGSSLGGFFATACVARHGVRAVLINPAVRPFERFLRYFQPFDPADQIGHTTAGGWQVRRSDLDQLRTLFEPTPVHPERILVLLKQGDEVLDYRVAEAHYSQDAAQCPMIVEPDGDHFMHDMGDKIPLMMDFLFPDQPRSCVQSI